MTNSLEPYATTHYEPPDQIYSLQKTKQNKTKKQQHILVCRDDRFNA